MNRRQPDGGQALRHLAEQLHAPRIKTQQSGCDNAAHHHKERHRLVLQINLPQDQHHERNPTGRKRCRIRLTQMFQEVAAVLPEIPVRAVNSEELWQLRRREEQERHTALESHHHAFVIEVDDRPALHQPRDHRDDRDQQRRARRQRPKPARIPTCNLPQRRAHQQRDCRRHRDDGVPRTAKQPEHQPGKKHAYNPASGGKFASDASPNPAAGRRYAASVIPATTSPQPRADTPAATASQAMPKAESCTYARVVMT